ncbi:MAG: hypothetical protein QNJ72_09335 [Pleurocapsa sp. MO_226.B13]|nr:hypothetical protein [Pleurocapsa sp. MO_226.B13]
MSDYPFAQELITDTQGNISKVIINFEDYQKILEMLEDRGLYRAMQDTENETPMSKEEALKELES